MQKRNLLDSVTIPLERELREKIHNALQGDIVELLSDITEPSKAPFYLQGCKDGRAFKIEKGFFQKILQFMRRGEKVSQLQRRCRRVYCKQP